MNTLERTVSMIKTLPEADQLKVQDFTEKLLRRNNRKHIDQTVDRFLKPMSKQDFLQDIAISKSQIVAGQYQDAKKSLAKLRAEYGI